MAQVTRIGDLEARKRALVRESEVYRQTLRLEVQNIRLYGTRLRRKFDFFSLAKPLFFMAGSFIGSRLFGQKAGAKRREGGNWIGLGFAVWRLVRTLLPLLNTQRNGRSAEGESPGTSGAAPS